MWVTDEFGGGVEYRVCLVCCFCWGADERKRASELPRKGVDVVDTHVLLTGRFVHSVDDVDLSAGNSWRCAPAGCRNSRLDCCLLLPSWLSPLRSSLLR